MVIMAAMAVASIGLKIAGGLSSNKAKKAQKKAAQIANQRMQAQNTEQLLQGVRQARIERASSLAASVASGGEYGSASAGALSSIGSQYTHNLNYAVDDMEYAKLIDHYQRKAGKYASQSSLYNSLGSSIGSLSSLTGPAGSIFGGSSAATSGLTNPAVTSSGGGSWTAQVNGNVYGSNFQSTN